MDSKRSSPSCSGLLLLPSLPGHEACILVNPGVTNTTTVDISLELNAEMSCNSVVNSISMNMSGSSLPSISSPCPGSSLVSPPSSSVYLPLQVVTIPHIAYCRMSQPGFSYAVPSSCVSHSLTELCEQVVGFNLCLTRQAVLTSLLGRCNGSLDAASVVQRSQQVWAAAGTYWGHSSNGRTDAPAQICAVVSS